MHQTYSLPDKIRMSIKIFLPILLSQILMNATSFLDTLMAGRASAGDLAGVAMATSIWIPFQTGLTGTLIAVTSIISNKLGGSASKENVRYFIIQALYVAFLMSLFSIFITFVFLNPLLDLLDLTERVQKIAHHFLLFLSTGFIPFFLYTVIRCFFDAHGKTKLSMYISFSILPINTVINYILIFGKFGFPKMGGVGTGIATSISYWIALIISIIFIYKSKTFKHYQLFSHLIKPNYKEWKELLQTGIPIGMSIFFEVSIFSVVTLLMSRFNIETIAAHQAALNFSSLLFMVPLSIAMSLTILTGYEYGAKRFSDAKQYAKIGISFAVLFAFLAAIILYLFRFNIAGLYSSNKELIYLTSNFLVFAIFFQVSDAIQAPIQGILRGYKDVKFALFMTLFGYWAVGLPIGYIFGTYTKLGAYGYWIGFISGLFTCALGLGFRLKYIQKKMALLPK
ncbi:MAG: multidrug transporter MatE [Bacillales bacterium]|jgi:MATE family multidrug resistance protein|nr:multidrug transporter MatE [Bacillales bacterium]